MTEMVEVPLVRVQELMRALRTIAEEPLTADQMAVIAWKALKA